MKSEERENLKKEIKEEIYVKYTQIVRSMLDKDYYATAQSTLSTFLALSMSAEATKKNLISMGIDSAKIESSRRAIIHEIWQLMEMHDKGILQELLEKHERETQEE
ncbi:hypothetical protein CL629_02055 [bacterium]|nr:hypothetical protein [bacterium]|tara:strand:- start:1238 stop:1555 length:318 start_codon:yes stop_codon:yes gene_type:complete